MRRRAEEIDASLEILSSASEGTTVNSYSTRAPVPKCEIG